MAQIERSILVTLGADIKAFQSKMQQASRVLKKTGAKMQSLGSKLSVGLTAPIAAFTASVVKTAGDFQTSMNKVAAISGATGKDLQALSNIAKEMGSTTQFSAKEAADGLVFLSQAGFSVKDQIKALPGVLNLAAAASMDLASAADIASNILSGYGKSAEELAGINDILVKTTSSANVNVEQLGESFKEAGPIASNLGISFEETAAALGVLGNAGIQGSKAGTVLKNVLANIAAPTEKMQKTMDKLGLSLDASSVKTLGFSGILKQLEDAGASTADIMTLFGKEAGPGVLAALQQGSKGLVDLRTKLEGAGGAAEKAAGQQMQGFNGAIKSLQSAFEGLQIAIAETGILELITDIIQGLSSFIRRLSKANPFLLKFAVAVAGIAAAAGPLIVAFGSILSALPAVIAAFKTFLFVLAPIALKIAAILAALTALAFIVKVIVDSYDVLKNFFLSLWTEIKAIFMKKIADILGAVSGFGEMLGIEMDGINETVRDFSDQAQKDLESLEETNFNDVLNEIAENVVKNFDKAKESVEGLVNTVQTAATSAAPTPLVSAAPAAPAAGGGLSLGLPTFVDPTTTEGINAYNKALQKTFEVVEGKEHIFQKLGKAVQGMSMQMQNAIGNAIVGLAKFATGATDSAKEVVKAFINEGVAALISGTLKKYSFTGPVALGIASAAGIGAAALFDKIVPGFANGGNFAGGLRMVGERGPEIEATGSSKIIPSSRLSNMMAGGASSVEVSGRFEIEGSDLVAVLERQNTYDLSQT